MNGIKRKSIPQEITYLQYNGCISNDDDMQEVENFYSQYERSDAYKTNGRFVKGY